MSMRVIDWILGRHKMAPAEREQPRRMHLTCPWCDGPLLHLKDGLLNAAICENDDCGFASKAALLSTIAVDILRERHFGKKGGPA
ncbi:MAG: hypothetical protein ACOY3V_08285 [Pseudomonadota bacterium]